MGRLVKWLDSRAYPTYAHRWDDSLFRQRILKSIGDKKDKVVLDLGAGAGIVTEMNFKGCAAKVVGIDPDPRVVDNPFLDEGKEGFGEAIPYPDATFDIVFADNVFEHLPNPDAVFAEVFRVLKAGGLFLAKTPNKYHYVPLIARLTPYAFHRWIVSWRGRAGEDVFPTLYRANSRGDVRKLAKKAGFDVMSIDLIEGRPEYLRFSSFTYLFGWIYERVVNHLSFFGVLRIVLIAELRKPMKFD